MNKVSKSIRVMTIFGTRPEAIKLAPVIARLRTNPEFFESIVVVTAQHRTMLDQMLDIFGIDPDVDLDIMQDQQSLFEITSRVLSRLEKVIAGHQPDVILVQGDTTSTFVAALAGLYFKCKVAHIEAGLRTGQKFSPFPEEMNRRLTSVLTDWHFAPTEQSRQNLLRENVDPQNIFLSGNTVVDAVLAILSDNAASEFPEIDKILSNCRRFIVVTAHRRENWGEAFESVSQAILELARQYPDLQFVFPVHLNPKVRQTFHSRLENQTQIHLLQPLDYRSFIHLLSHSHFILTDSGGIQEEAPTLRKPALIMREVTERPEGLAGGLLKLVGCDAGRIIAESKRLLDDPDYYQQLTCAENPYGDGRAAQRICDALSFTFGLRGSRPDEFHPPGSLQ